MKKIYALVGALCLALAFLILGSVLLTKYIEKNPETLYDYIESKEVSSNASKSENVSFNQMFHVGITEKEHKVDKVSAEEHERIYTDLGEVKVDGFLNSEEWEDRLSKGLTAENLNAANRECSGLFYYDKIDNSLKQLYLEIYLAFTNNTESIFICSNSPEDIEFAFNCVLGDHPEIFYINGYMYTKYTSQDEIIKIEFTPAFTMDKAVIEKYNQEIDDYYDAFKKGISDGAGEYDKIKYTYEFVILNTEYDLNSPENQNIISVFKYGKSVCQGYAKAFQYLSGRLGIQSTLVVGRVGSDEGHAWNMVKCDGEYYYVDCTWGDSSYLNRNTADNSLNVNGINYDYLNITTKELELTHQIENFELMPVCFDKKANYYVREGLYFSAIDPDKLASAFTNSTNTGKTSVNIKCSDELTFNEMGKYLLDENHIFDYIITENDTLTYSKNQGMFIYYFPIDY
ncbi:MAG: hypothetical protein K5776_11675 [Lachnospiraceae bacterium]|nr:hypothetical protein [Lachnospiraceae bacterium]